jgi:hypothetical protein
VTDATRNKPLWNAVRMRVVTPFAALAVVLASPVSAEAAPIRECGNAGIVYDGHVRIFNVTSRNVACWKARRFARRQMLNAGPACREDRYCTSRGWRCTHFPGDIRCVGTGRVIRWHYE